VSIIPDLDERNIPEDIDEEDEEDGDEEEEGESVTIEEDDTGYARSVHVCTLNTQVEVVSNDPKDSLKDIKDMAEALIDKYKSI